MKKKRHFQLGTFRVEPTRNVVLLDDQSFSIEPRIMDVLCLLAETPGEVVARDDLISEIWNVQHGADESVTRAISVLRRTFREAGVTEPYIETVPKRGYRLAAPVQYIAGANPEIGIKNDRASSFTEKVDVTAVAFENSHVQVTPTQSNTLRFVGLAIVAMGVLAFAVFSYKNGNEQIPGVLSTGDAVSAEVSDSSEKLEAFRLYQEGRNLLNKRGRNISHAIIKFEAAIELDPRFARAYAGLATAHLVSASYLRTPTEVAHSRAREMAKKALELNDQLSEPDAVLAAIEGLRNNWSEALDYLDRAEQNDPNNTRVKQWYSEGLLNLGFADAGLEKIVAAVAIEPASGVLNHVAANAFTLVGDYESAIQYYERAQQLGFEKARLTRGLIYFHRGEYAAAAEAYALYAREIGFIATDRVADLEQFVQRIIAGEIVLSENLEAFPTLTQDEDLLAILYLFAGDSVEFLKLIEEDVDSDKAWFWMVWSDFIPGIQEHPYFASFVKNTGLVTYWRDRGFPKTCKVSDNTELVCASTVHARNDASVLNAVR